MDNRSIARTLFDAFSSGDNTTVRKLCADTISIRQYRGENMDPDTLLALSSKVLPPVSNFRYEDTACCTAESGFAEEHWVCGKLADGLAGCLRSTNSAC